MFALKKANLRRSSPQNLKSKDAGHSVVSTSGEKVRAVFGFAIIEAFDDIIEWLQEEVMVFVNDIAQVVHTQVVQNKGSPNKSIGKAFLLVCKVHRLLSFQDSSVSSYPPLCLPSAVCPPQLTFPAGF